MTLSSLPFVVFLPVTFFGFYLLKDKFRIAFLLLASYAFYASFLAPHLLVVLSLVVYVTYRCAIRLEELARGPKRRVTFWAGIGGCVLFLVASKYLPVFYSSHRAGAGVSRLLLFVGVSYYCLQAVSYLADVYNGRTRAERQLASYALYLSFFPKLLQGPIERASVLLPQLKQRQAFDYDSVRFGLLQFAWGLFKKVVVADRLALFVGPIYGDVHAYQGIALLTASYLYAFQIYCDFSGYTDMALGVGRLFNIRLTQNFRAPYFATSITDFWRRWHISLSTWLRDYLYLPLSYSFSRHINAAFVLGVDSNVVIYCASIVLTFLAAGVWHGTAWTYVAWGLIHGIYLATSNITRHARKRVARWSRGHPLLLWSRPLLQTVFTFHLVVLSWVFFRAESLSDSRHVLAAIISDVKRCLDLGYVRLQFRGLGLRESDLALVGLLVLVVVAADLIEERSGSVVEKLVAGPGWARWSVCYALAFCILYLSPYNGAGNYIYMQF